MRSGSYRQHSCDNKKVEWKMGSDAWATSTALRCILKYNGRGCWFLTLRNIELEGTKKKNIDNWLMNKLLCSRTSIMDAVGNDPMHLLLPTLFRWFDTHSRMCILCQLFILDNKLSGVLLRLFVYSEQKKVQFILTLNCIWTHKLGFMVHKIQFLPDSQTFHISFADRLPNICSKPKCSNGIPLIKMW